MGRRGYYRAVLAAFGVALTMRLNLAVNGLGAIGVLLLIFGGDQIAANVAQLQFGFDRLWLLMPLGAIVVYDVLKANRIAYERLEAKRADLAEQLAMLDRMIPSLSGPTIVGPEFSSALDVYELEFTNTTPPPLAPTLMNLTARIERVNNDGTSGRGWVAQWTAWSNNPNNMGPLDKTEVEASIPPGHHSRKLPVVLRFKSETECYLWSSHEHMRAAFAKVDPGRHRIQVHLKSGEIDRRLHFEVVNEPNDFRLVLITQDDR